MKYGVITGYGAVEFENELNEHIQEGWEVAGQLNTTHSHNPEDSFMFSILISKGNKRGLL